MRKIRDNHMNFVKSPNIVCKRTSTHEHYKAILGLQTNKRGCLSETRHLLNHNDVGSQHLKTSGEVHKIGPAKNQSPSHRHDLFCHSSGPQHTQDHNQNRVANSATEMQGNEAWMNAFSQTFFIRHDNADFKDPPIEWCMCDTRTHKTNSLLVPSWFIYLFMSKTKPILNIAWWHFDICSTLTPSLVIY